MNATSTRDRLVDRRTQVIMDMDELEDQVDDDLVEEAAAERLRGIYTRELAEIDEALAGLVETVDEPEILETAAGDVRGFSLRAVLGAAGILVVITALIGWAATRPGPDVAETQVTSSDVIVQAGEIDINAMTTPELEDALLSFPESAAVRLILADRHLAEGDQQSALEHYLVVATGNASPNDRSRALARVGYLSYATGQYGPAKESLTQSLELNRNNTEAMLYLGYVLLNGFADPAAAIPYFEKVVADPLMPPEIVSDVLDKLAEARRILG